MLQIYIMTPNCDHSYKHSVTYELEQVLQDQLQ